MKKISKTKQSIKSTISLFLLLMAGAVIISACKKDKDEEPDPTPQPNAALQAQVRVQVAYDATNAAFHFTWKSQAKTLPAGFANTGKVYPGHFHDMLKHNGTKFDRLPSGERMEEDRVSFMIEKFENGTPGFATATCAMTCHTGMTSHKLLTPNVVDHWHWRGGRSGPMGYAEDAAVNDVERIRDNLGTPPSKFTRSGGDRFREDQAALSGTGHGVLVDGLPRFVFNKGKSMPGNFNIPAYFIANTNNAVVTDPYIGLPVIKEVTKNRSLLVVFQDKTFDPIDKVNAIDLGYLVYVALGTMAHLPAHLQVDTDPAFIQWKDFWASELGIAATAGAQALAKLDDIYSEWNASNKNGMVTRSVAFIYPSDQHDITSKHEFDVAKGEWSVTLYRKLATGSNRDADIAGMAAGTKYAFSFAMHDNGGAAITHNISLPLTISNTDATDVKASQVSDVKTAKWNNLPYFDTYYVKNEFFPKWTEEWISGVTHMGASQFTTRSCVSCHTDGKLTYSTVLP